MTPSYKSDSLFNLEKQSALSSQSLLASLTKSNLKMQRSKSAPAALPVNRKRKRDLEPVICIDEFLQVDSDEEDDNAQQLTEPFLQRFEKIPINAFRKFRKQSSYGNIRRDYSRLEMRGISNFHDRSLSHFTMLKQPLFHEDIFMND
jgi:hypothetical protein